MRRAGSLKICSSQIEFSKSLLGGSSRSRSPELQSLRRAAQSVSELLRPGMTASVSRHPDTSVSQGCMQQKTRISCCLSISHPSLAVLKQLRNYATWAGSLDAGQTDIV